MRVTVKWLTSPRAIGIPRAMGTFSSLDEKRAKEILEEYPGIFEYQEDEKEDPIEPKDTMAKEARTRPVKKKRIFR